MIARVLFLCASPVFFYLAWLLFQPPGYAIVLLLPESIHPVAGAAWFWISAIAALMATFHLVWFVWRRRPPA